MSNIKKESSTTANVAGFLPPLGRDPLRKKIMPDEEEAGDPIMNPELFEDAILEALVNDEDISEVVRKQGNQYVLYDDDTDVKKATYNDRDTAWEKQRQIRRIEKNKKKHKETEKKIKRRQVPGVDQPKKTDKPKKAPEPKKAPKPKLARVKKKQKVRKLEGFIKELFASVLNEGSMISYVFENSPMSDETTAWENFIAKLSKQTIMSDPKLNKIIHNIAKTELSVLKKAMKEVKDNLERTKHFAVVSANKLSRDGTTNDPKIDFVVHMRDNKKKIKFAIKLDNGKPLFMWEDAKDTLDQLANDESKLLRAEMIHMQETAFKQVEDVMHAIERRNRYLKSLEQKFDKILSSVSPLEIGMLKHLIKQKFQSVR